MKRGQLFALCLSALVVFACAAGPRDLSPSAAEAEARGDIQSGHMKVYMAGTIASGEVGVAPDERYLIKGLPRDNSLSKGCMDRLAGEHITYAKTYNRAIVAYLRGHRRPI